MGNPRRHEGPFSEIKAATADPRFPKLAKVRRLMGLSKPGEKRYVVTKRMMESIETLELTRSVMIRARIWSAVRRDPSDISAPV